EHLRPDIVNIVNNPDAEQLKWERNQKQQVGRIAQMNDPEPVSSPGFPRQTQFSKECRSILAEKAAKSSGFFADPMPIDLYPLQHLLGLGVPTHFGAYDYDLVAGIAQSTSFLPDSTIEGHR